MKLSPLQIEDYRRWYIEDPTDFSPERNKAIIDETIRKTNEMRLKKQKEYHEQVRVRADAVAHYLKAVDQGKEANVDKYFGKRILSELRGKRILSILKNTAEGKMKELYDVGSY